MSSICKHTLEDERKTPRQKEEKMEQSLLSFLTYSQFKGGERGEGAIEAELKYQSGRL